MKTKLILVTVAAALVLTGVWYFALWSPQGDKLSNAKEERAAAQAKVTELEVKVADLKRHEKNKETLEASRDELAAAIPNEDELDQFILEVNERASVAGVNFVSVAPAQPGAAGAVTAGPAPIGLQMQVQGDYFAILRFMEQLRDADRLVTVDNFSLSRGGEGGQMSASIGGRMFMGGAAAPTTDTASA